MFNCVDCRQRLAWADGAEAEAEAAAAAQREEGPLGSSVGVQALRQAPDAARMAPAAARAGAQSLLLPSAAVSALEASNRPAMNRCVLCAQDAFVAAAAAVADGGVTVHCHALCFVLFLVARFLFWVGCRRDLRQVEESFMVLSMAMSTSTATQPYVNCQPLRRRFSVCLCVCM